MFDLLPNLLSSLISILLPIFASYKALQTSDPAHLTPWLMYWIIFSIFGLFEYWTYFVLSWVPFYSWARLFVLAYLVFPQTQGAKRMYQAYIHPFLTSHERQIESSISSVHEKAYALGLSYINRIVEAIKNSLLSNSHSRSESTATADTTTSPSAFSSLSGLQRSRQVSGSNYAQSLLSRFSMPNAIFSPVSPSNDFYGLLGSAMSLVGSGQVTSAGHSGLASREKLVEDISRSGKLLPPGLGSLAEKKTFLATQREQILLLLSALDQKANDLNREPLERRDVSSTMAGSDTGLNMPLKKSKSEAEFEEIGRDESEDVKCRSDGSSNSATATGWMPWLINSATRTRKPAGHEPRQG